MSNAPALIAVDWGSSSFRTFLVSEAGEILDERRSEKGAFQISNHETALAEMCADWCTAHGNLPIRMGGSIGSRNGWQETGYVPCPVSAGDMKEAFEPVANSLGWDIAVLPGVSVVEDTGECDVMRGEETQIFGAMHLLGAERGMFCLPGTHSKWCRVEDGAITHINSYLTGEMFALLRAGGSLSSLISTEQYDEVAFLDGLQAIRQQPNLLKLLFRARAGVLLDCYPADRLASFLSGALIGYEISSAIQSMPLEEAVTIVAGRELEARYRVALNFFDQPHAVVGGEDAFLAGMKLLVR